MKANNPRDPRIKARRQGLQCLSMIGALVATATATAEAPTREQLTAEAAAQQADNRQFERQMEASFRARSRYTNEDRSAELQIGGDIDKSLKSADSQASVERMECRESICRVEVRMKSAADRPSVLIALLGAHQCGVTVPDQPSSAASLTAYLDCASR